jgi:hypothetical protein
MSVLEASWTDHSDRRRQSNFAAMACVTNLINEVIIAEFFRATQLAFRPALKA